MNRGSEGKRSRLGPAETCMGFNEAPIHESGKCLAPQLVGSVYCGTGLQ